MAYKDPEKTKLFHREYYKKNKTKSLERSKTQRIAAKIWFGKLREFIGCVICADRREECLEFHHLNAREKESSVSEMVSRNRNKRDILLELEKTVCLCSNCHKTVHSGRICLTEDQIGLSRGRVKEFYACEA